MQNRHIPASELADYRALMGAPTPSTPLAPTTHPTPAEEQETSAAWQRLRAAFTSPYLSPLCSESLADLPATLVVTNGDDVLADEGRWYAQRLQREGAREESKEVVKEDEGEDEVKGNKTLDAGGDNPMNTTDDSDDKCDKERESKTALKPLDERSIGEDKRSRGRVTHVHYEHSYHGAMTLIPFTREALDQRQALVDFLDDFYA